MKSIIVVLSVALVALGGTTLHLWRQQEIDRQQIADLQTRPSAMAAAAQVAQSRHPTQPVAVQEDRPGTVPATAGDPQPTPVRGVQETEAASYREALASPENQARARTLFRAMLPDQYPDIGEALDLSPDMVNRLFELLERQNAESQRAVNTGPKGGESGMQAFGRRMQANETEVAALLSSKYPQWQQYRSELPQRQQVRDLKIALRAGGMPLSDTQSKPLISALVAAEKRISSDGGTSKIGAGRHTPEYNQARIDAASPYLSAQQIEAYQQLLDRQATRARMYEPPPGLKLETNATPPPG